MFKIAPLQWVILGCVLLVAVSANFCVGYWFGRNHSDPPLPGKLIITVDLTDKRGSALSIKNDAGYLLTNFTWNKIGDSETSHWAFGFTLQR